MSVTSGTEPISTKQSEPIRFYIEVASENSLMVYFGTNNANLQPEISLELCAMIGRAQTLIKSSLGDTVLDTIPSYSSLMITYDLWLVDHFHIRNRIQKLIKQLVSDSVSEHKLNGNTFTLPVYYDTCVGPDLPRIAKNAGISIEEVIQLHVQQEYYVYTIGFAPGFAYLGEVNETIAMPRLATPRATVAQGSVAIADKQTAIYPAPSPGGWNIIGRCPTPMFNPNSETPIPVAVGDKVRFKAITETQFLELGGQL
ncbi:5-oxoprolinase subunit PxpB [Thalassotalea litorea]|uniref:5-oxoprolinase subunit PxpB n=1 Tax=Thalassotalea litorea TaxID=2020715 RepID=A0A5R9IT29_9GAMM|nr:5-oxoprolinase subunit PxpB [Thalassotalea litorea]TLU67653.1 5-oxoprolinase subunit PxpB [Thalassotalea litorea]